MERVNKQGGSINRGGRTNLLQTIVGEALLRMSRVENWYEIYKRGGSINRGDRK